MKDVLLITPPFTQINTPYPATAYIKGFLNTKGISSFQMDLGIEVILALFTKEKLQQLFQEAKDENRIISDNCNRIFTLRQHYFQTINEVLAFLQGKNQTLARQICTDTFLPRASRFDQLSDLDWSFGNMGLQDRAKHLATLYLEDLSDFFVECVDENFGFSRYAERLGESANSFDELYSYLQQPLTKIDEISKGILSKRLLEAGSTLVCFSVPFPGNLYSAFRCAQWIRKDFPEVKIAMGGGFPNTELRSLKDSRVFDFFHFITLDDGELPIELLFNSIKTGSEGVELKRTFILENKEVKYVNNSIRSDYKQADVGTPDYSDLLWTSYISVIQIANPMHSLWSDGRWLKLTMAHGCYWGKCTFCDISLDYIKIYEPVAAQILVDRMEQLISETGENGFHFVDEAAPPSLMKALSLEILKRELTVSWWTNIRFEKNFTKDLCVLLKASGCIAVSGGLEVASDRLLKLIDKGTTVEQVAKVARNLTDSGIMVHAYLMYGYPTQTIQETVDSLEIVRQLFEADVLQSGFWHQFALTAHSPIGLNPKEFGVIPHQNTITFANNDIQFVDSTGIDHSQFSYGLKKSLYNFMQGIGFDLPLQDWFDFKIPKTKIVNVVIRQALDEPMALTSKETAKLFWIGSDPISLSISKTKRGIVYDNLQLTFHNKTSTTQVLVENEKGDWLVNLLKLITVSNGKGMSFGEVRKSYETQFHDFDVFWYSKPLLKIRDLGLLNL